MLNLAQRFPAKARKGHKKEKAALKEHKLHALCPYFAMFPPAFAREQILAHTKTGELCYDPFSGRGTTLLEALLNDRKALASDINPVAYCISVAKAQAPTLGDVLSEIDSARPSGEREAHWADVSRVNAHPDFLSVLSSGVFARRQRRECRGRNSSARGSSSPSA